MHDHALDIGQAVRDRRRVLDLTQVELAELARCSTRFVHTVESGKPTVRLDKLVAVLDVLGLELHVARRGSGRRP